MVVIAERMPIGAYRATVTRTNAITHRLPATRSERVRRKSSGSRRNAGSSTTVDTFEVTDIAKSAPDTGASQDRSVLIHAHAAARAMTANAIITGSSRAYRSTRVPRKPRGVRSHIAATSTPVQNPTSRRSHQNSVTPTATTRTPTTMRGPSTPLAEQDLRGPEEVLRGRRVLAVGGEVAVEVRPAGTDVDRLVAVDVVAQEVPERLVEGPDREDDEGAQADGSKRGHRDQRPPAVDVTHRDP
ncbi:hypothetical protein [Curtobacterium sp. MCPF17_052]|uniref:hypothetical protein n=1 Tax=Curtobacterium sp. MCPF17_052 TaxID=2175655 RepID=UPI0024DF8AC7|nr:hypothetical protein [Curtobacterium sp. MCPF17_052]WIB12401.1 hypothetical protein DEJ36_17285 [Curtobacterium sp. MCPF17_052]